MMTIGRSKRFNTEYKKFVKHNNKRAESIIKAIDLFVNDPEHPGLNVEKLKASNIWTLRLSEGNRLFFLWVNEKNILLVYVGKHDKYKNYL